MSTLKVTNIQSNAAGFNDVVSFQNSSGTQNGTLCRAWVSFNGTGVVAISASFNVTSITDRGTGKYDVNFTNSMSDSSYVATGNVQKNDSNDDGNQYAQLGGNTVRPQTASMLPVITGRIAAVQLHDCGQIMVAVFR
jgi:hypothetical protein